MNLLLHMCAGKENLLLMIITLLQGQNSYFLASFFWSGFWQQVSTLKNGSSHHHSLEE